VRRLGSVREQRANIRIVTATNRDLEAAVHEGSFRADLLFRLRIVHFELPPLRARGDDVLDLAEYYLDLHRRRYGKPHLRFTAEAEQALLRYRWPGNVRELRNLLEQAVIMATAADGSARDAPELNPADVERDVLLRALGQAGGNVSQAARLLGVSRDTVRYRIEKHGLKPLESPGP
jgi:two-component system response regulator AtoC